MSEAVQNNPKSYRLAKVFFIFLVLSIFGLIMHGYYLQNMRINRLVLKVDMLSKQYDSKLDSLNFRIDNLNYNISQIQKNLSELTNTNSKAVNYQLNQLIALANQSILVYGDVAATIKLLIISQNILVDNNDAIYSSLKFAISSDLSNLSHINSAVDSVTLAGKLNNIMVSIDELPLNVNNKTPLNNNLDSTTSKFKLFLYHIRDTLLSLVQVSRLKKNNESNLLLEDGDIIIQNIKLDVLNARMALLLHDENSWVYNLNNIKTNLENYFVINNQRDAILNQIDELSRTNISVSNININNTLSALNQLNNLTK